MARATLRPRDPQAALLAHIRRLYRALENLPVSQASIRQLVLEREIRTLTDRYRRSAPLTDNVDVAACEPSRWHRR